MATFVALPKVIPMAVAAAWGKMKKEKSAQNVRKKRLSNCR